MNIANNLANTALYFPDRWAVVVGDRQVTYRQFNLESGKIAAALADAGVQPGDHVALCAPNSYEWLAFYFGVLKAGAVAVTFSHMLTGAELPQILSDCQPKVLFTVNEKLEVVREWKSRTGLDIHESYGMTESASMVTYNHYYRHVVGSVGTPVNLIEVQIRDFDGNMLETGNRGEICICGPNIAQGYLNNAAETQTAFWGDWFRSGDIGLFDDDGYLYIVDRLKDMIITGGENVYPREVEELLYTHPEIQECAVVGLPDKDWGERVAAFIVPQKNQQPEPAVIKSFLKEHLAGFKVPKEFIVVESCRKAMPENC